ncbi:hypothetical protein Poly30_34090 [Planctomycetes bacterium Poly30]|uniref:Xylose isomerase-like TIM barrel n=1 Tax=Saltatorellus ferox TaxID=2528018 RepID=A0A518EUU7_9BACT|nr:hypothetical protein Poly30_34090 [Planctomycetes bacterium Poly30]
MLLTRATNGRRKGPGGPAGSAPVRLAYCLNLHAAKTLAEVAEVLRTYTVPLRNRILGADSQEPFGVGMYFEAPAAAELAGDPAKLSELAALMAEERLDPFTFNAFPYGGFQEDGLKERVYAPTWEDEARLRYTVDVARVAARLQSAIRVSLPTPLQGDASPRYLSISTHPGAYGADITDRSSLRRCAQNMGRAVAELAKLEAEFGHRIVLSLESEPDASARNSRALAEYLVFARLVGSKVLQDEFDIGIEASGALMLRHLGVCLDCCHSAVEFEAPSESLRLAALGGGPLGKIQFSSALSLAKPAAHPAAVEALLGLDEPRFLHQVTGRSAEGEFLHLRDLPALQAEVARGAESPWPGAEEWRCHFHVPVDLKDALGLVTTRPHADAILAAAITEPASWSVPELHVEIETYTWSVLPGGKGSSPSEDAIVEGLEAEYRYVLERCSESGRISPGTETDNA